MAERGAVFLLGLADTVPGEHCAGIRRTVCALAPGSDAGVLARAREQRAGCGADADCHREISRHAPSRYVRCDGDVRHFLFDDRVHAELGRLPARIRAAGLSHRTDWRRAVLRIDDPHLGRPGRSVRPAARAHGCLARDRPLWPYLRAALRIGLHLERAWIPVPGAWAHGPDIRATWNGIGRALSYCDPL